MTELEIVQLVNIGIILITIFSVVSVVSIPKYRVFWLWFIPIFLLLLDSLVFRSVILIDALDGKLDITSASYNIWSDVVHLHDKITILVYASAILYQNYILKMKEPKLIETILSWTKEEDD